MAYTDKTRSMIAKLIAMHPQARPTVWLLPRDGEAPVPTRRTTGLRQYRIVSQRQELVTAEQAHRRTYGNVANYGREDYRWSGARPSGLHITRVEDVVTGQQFEMPAMGNGQTVWIEDPNPGKNEPEPVVEPEPEETVEALEAPEPVTVTRLSHRATILLAKDVLIGEFHDVELVELNGEPEYLSFPTGHAQAVEFELQDGEFFITGRAWDRTGGLTTEHEFGHMANFYAATWLVRKTLRQIKIDQDKLEAEMAKAFGEGE